MKKYTILYIVLISMLLGLHSCYLFCAFKSEKNELVVTVAENTEDNEEENED